MAPSIAIEGSRVCAWTGYMLKPGAPSLNSGRNAIQELALRRTARAIPHSTSKERAIMGNYALDAIRSRVLNALHELEQSVRKLRALAKARKPKSAKSDARQTQKSEAQRTQELHALGTQWEEQICAFENCVIKELPRHVREKLLDGEDSVSRAWVLRFKPRNSTVVDQLEPYARFDIEAAGGWHRCITWDTKGAAPSRILTVKALLQNSDWKADWKGVGVALTHAKQVFEDSAASGRTDLTPNEADIEASIRELVATNQPEWMPDGAGIEASQFALNIKEGTLPEPHILEVHALRREIQSREEPIRVEQLVKRVLEELRRSGDLKLFSYRPIGVSKEASYYYLAELSTATSANGGASGHFAANIFRMRGDFWEVQFQGEPTPLAQIKDSVGMKRLHQLLLCPGKSIPATDLCRVEASTPVRRGEGPQHAEFAQGVQGESFMDQEGLAKHKTAHVDLEKELAKAEKENDESAKERIQRELDIVTQAILKAVGPAGSLRTQVDQDANKARKTVHATMTSAIERLRKHAPKLAAHLAANIVFGVCCSYRREEQVPWQLSDDVC